MTLSAALAHAQIELRKKNIKNPKLESELLLGHIMGLERVELYTHPDINLSKNTLDDFNQLLERKKKHEPTAYILKRKYFYKNEFTVMPGVLIPRPETEFVVEAALENLDRNAEAKILDFGCGTGCIGISILLERPDAKLVSVDISESSIEVTRINAQKLGVLDRIKTVKTQVEELILNEKFDSIVANPPYIATNDQYVDECVKKFEPHEALYCAENGFEKIRNWSIKAGELLNPNGTWVFEVGHKQANIALNFLKSLEIFKNYKIQKDLQGIDRVICAVKR